MFLYIFKAKEKLTSFSASLLYISVLQQKKMGKYTETLICLVKLIGQWIPDGDGQGIAKDVQK